MTLLADADAIYLGSQAADAVYAGAVQVWPPAALDIVGTPVTDGVEYEHGIGSSYAGFTVTASGGTPPYTYNIIAGEWPVGVSLDPATGVVSGTPGFESAGVYAGIIIRAMDAVGAIGKLAPFTLTIEFKDPYYYNVNLLLDYDAPNGTSVFTDQKNGVAAVTPTSTRFSTAQVLYGTSSIRFNGSDSNLRFPDSPSWDLGADPFTIDFTLRPDHIATITDTFMICQFGGATPNLSWVFSFKADGRVVFGCSTTGTDNLNAGSTEVSMIEAGVWSRWRVDYTGTEYRIYKDGVMLRKTVATHTKAAINQPLVIGSNSASNAWFFWGYARGIRLTVGTARTASDFGYTTSNRAFPAG